MVASLNKSEKNLDNTFTIKKISVNGVPFRSYWQKLTSIVMIVLSAFLASVPMGMNTIIFPITMETYGFSSTMIGIIMSSGTAIGVVIYFFLSQFLNSTGLLKSFILSTLLRISGVILLSYVSDEFHWFLLILIKSSGSFLFLVLLQVWINSIPSNKHRGLVSALFGASTSLGLAAGPVVLQLIELKLDLLDNLWLTPIFVNVPLQVPFFISAIFSFLAVIPIILIAPLAPSYKQNKQTNLLRIVYLSPAILFAVAMGAASHFGISAFVVLYGERNGLSLETASLLYTAFILGGLLLEIPLGGLSDFFDRRYVIITIAFLNIACAVYLPIAIYVSYQAWILLFIWGGIIGALYSICLAVIGERFEGELVTATAAYSVMDNGGGTIGILLIGIAMDIFGVDGFPYTIMLVSIVYFSFALTRYRVV